MESPAVSPSTVACLTVLGLESVAGVIITMFMLSVTLQGLLKGMSSTEKILAALGISNLIFSVTNFLFILGVMVWLENNTILFGIAMYSVTSCTWLTTCLCLFYFFKILHFRWAFLSWVKMKIDAVVPWLILGSEVVSVCSSASCMLPNGFQKASSNDLPRNISTNETSEVGNVRLTSANVSFFINFIPFLIGVLTTFSTFTYLKLHSYRMRMNMGSRGGANLKAHQTAANTLIRLLVLYAIIYLAIFLYCFGFFPEFSIWYWMTVIISFSFTPTQSVFLILGNPKMKDALRKTLCFLKCSKDEPCQG